MVTLGKPLSAQNLQVVISIKLRPGKYAYVDFATADAKTVATTLSENHLDGRRLLIKDGV